MKEQISVEHKDSIKTKRGKKFLIIFVSSKLTLKVEI